MCRNIGVAEEPEPTERQQAEQYERSVEHKRKRQGEAPEQREIKKIRREQRCRTEQQRHALMYGKIGQFVVTKAYKRGERKPCKRDECRERKKKLWCFRTVNTVECRADLIGIACQTQRFRGGCGLVHAACHQCVTLVTEVGQKFVFNERTRRFPSQLLSRGAGKVCESLRQNQDSRLLSARGRPRR